MGNEMRYYKSFITKYHSQEYFCIFQYDEGGNTLLPNRFTSFVKARILCSVPGTISFDYNEKRKF